MSPEQQENAIRELETLIDRLHALYNQYFLGIEKLEPMTARKNVERKIQTMRRIKLNNTALRFRLQTQIQKFNTHRTYWQRICRQIEEGTYRRDLARADMRQRRRESIEPPPPDEASAEEAGPPVVDLSGEDLLGADEMLSGAAQGTATAEGAIGDLDDPFGEVGSKAAATPEATGPGMSFDLDEPDLPTTGKAPRAASRPRDPDKTPVPDAKALSAEVRRELSSAPPERRVADEQSSPDDELKTFFNRPSVPPPPPAPGTAPTPVRSAPPPRRGAKGRPVPRQPAKAKVGAAAPAKPVAKAAPPKKTAAALDDARMKKVYKTYLAAKKRCNEPTERLSFDKVARSLRKQYESKGGGVDFKVVIRGGKAVIKTVKD